jgi:phage tail sheath protein FI
MAFQVSPGVQVQEIDATNVVPAVSTSIGGFAGAFNWGPVEQIVTVGSENELAATFGTPDDSTAKHFLVAASFLKYGNALKVVRVASGHLNATAQGTGQLIKNNEHYLNNYADGSLNLGAWAAKHPGVLGNSIKVSMITAGASPFSGWTYASNFDAAPGTSASATAAGVTNDELHIAVIDEDGALSGTPGTVLETFGFVSQASDAKKDDGSTNYYKDVINNQSNYIRWIDHDTNLLEAGFTLVAAKAVTGGTGDAEASNSFHTHASAIEASLAGGVDDNTPTTGEIAAGFDLLEDAETVDVNLLFAAADADGAEVIAEDLISIVNARKDCMAFISPPLEDTVNNATPAASVKAFADGLTSTSYASCDSTALYVYDKYNDKYRYIAASGHMAGLCANTDSVADAWFSPAGVNRGQLLGVTKLAFNPKKADRDSLYKARVNPIVSLPGQGTLLFGDKTLLSRPSAFDRINVRRLFIVLEKAVSTAAKAQLFEFNDEFTRAQFRNLVEPFLRDVKGRRGLTDFSVICDNTNNTSSVIDGNKFVADIFIKPARSINFITLSFVATRSGVEFSEISGS